MIAEYRTCPVSGRTVIIAPQRASRPVALEHFAPHHRHRDDSTDCPFCPGNEHLTPEAVHTIPGRDGWDLRVVPNKFPATGGDAIGEHEVVIECRRHLADPLELSGRQLAAVFMAYRERMKALLADPRIRSVSAFKNVGAEAGASLPHNHSQLIATPFVPDAMLAELHNSESYHASTGRNVFADMLDDSERLVASVPGFRALCPYAPRFAYEVWIVPERHSSRFETIRDAECRSLARLLKKLLAAQDRLLHRPAYNWLVHSAPAEVPHFRWHLEILPRTERAAGFEWGTGIFINSVPPEAAASQLRARLPHRHDA